jgi:myo-inositol catabolism protein IolC
VDLGYDDKLFILAFDHRGSFRTKMFGIRGREATPEEESRLKDGKRLIWEGLLAALEAGAPSRAAGVLVDEEMGADVARAAGEAGLILAMPVEKSGQDVFDFEYGDDFGAHIEVFDPAFAKVLVRWNPDDDPTIKALQGERLKSLGDWLHGNGRRFLFELLVPPSDRQLALVGGSSADYDSFVRPYLMLEVIDELQRAGVEPDVWKIEGIDSGDDCRLVANLTRSSGRAGVKVVVLGRGADEPKVEHWVRTGAPIDGYIGFAIGRTIWWAGVEAWKDRKMTRAEATRAIAGSYRRFVDIYQQAAG